MPAPAAARKHYLWTSALARRAVERAEQAKASGATAVAEVILTHQATAAFQATPAVAAMLNQQGIDERAMVALNPGAFTTTTASVTAMLEQVEVDWQFQRLVTSLVLDAARSSEQAATAARPKVGYVRYLSPPSCSRCAILSGRVYRYSTGFLRHPGCDCSMVPTSLDDPAFIPDPIELMQRGQVTGLSKADQKAINDGADFGMVVNRHRTGLGTPGRAIARLGRPTPEAIYKAAASRADALQAMAAAGYVR